MNNHFGIVLGVITVSVIGGAVVLDHFTDKTAPESKVSAAPAKAETVVADASTAETVKTSMPSAPVESPPPQPAAPAKSPEPPKRTPVTVPTPTPVQTASVPAPIEPAPAPIEPAAKPQSQDAAKVD